eukprot:1222879-Amphidinium_carterae.1
MVRLANSLGSALDCSSRVDGSVLIVPPFNMEVQIYGGPFFYSHSEYAHGSNPSAESPRTISLDFFWMGFAEYFGGLHCAVLRTFVDCAWQV